MSLFLKSFKYVLSCIFSVEKIVLDTNFLLAVFELKVDIFAEIERVCDFRYELFILDRTLDEVENLIKSSLLSKRRAAKGALQLIKLKNIQILASNDSRMVDDILVDLKGYIIATVDMELKRRLRKEGIQIITIRQKKYIMLE
ncbi:PIN domain-containing protein [Candidatus Woesearchaeota archaeon]|nr:PIN domain-containing protein [Candidatus Woesearchaeota archaeon]